MAFKVKGSFSGVNSILKGGVVFDNEKLENSQQIPLGKFTINELDDSTSSDLANNTLVANFGKDTNTAGMLSFNTGDWENSNVEPVKLMMRVINNGNDSDWVTIFDSSKTTVTWSSIATAGQTTFTVPNLDFKSAVVFVNGILQVPGLSYTTYGGTITFADNLSINDQLYVLVGENSSSTEITYESLIATAGQTSITLSNTSASNNMLYINGVFQYPNSYTISSGVITLNSELDLNDNIYVVSNNSNVSSSYFTATEDQSDFTLTTEPEDPYVYINGILQYDNSYTISGTTLSFITRLNENDSVFVYYEYPNFIDQVSATYIKNIENSKDAKSLNIPYFHFSELQVFINGILQNPDNGSYTLNGTEVTLSSGLQVNDDIHVIVYNSPVQSDNFLTKADLSSYATKEELEYLKSSLANEGINLKWNAHLPSIEVAFGLPRRSLHIWEPGSTGNNSKYWLYPVTGTVWTGEGTLGTVPDAPFYQLTSNKDVITWTYTATSDNISTIYIPYNFGTVTIFINGVLQSVELGNYTYSGQYITLNGTLQTGDNLIAILGKLVFNTNPYLTVSNANNIYVNYNSLSSNNGANLVGTDSGLLQDVLNNFSQFDNEISGADGYKNIGKVKSISELRTIEPKFNGQKILLERAIDGGPLLNEILTSDNTVILPDNDFSIFRTVGGNTWLANIENGHNVFMAGFSEDLNNLSQCINKISEWYVKISIEDVQINNRRGIILVPPLSYKTTYTMTEGIKLPPSLITLKPLSTMIFDFSNYFSSDAIICSHEYNLLTSGKGNSKNGNSADAGGYVIDPIGTLYVKGPGITISKDSSGNSTSISNTPYSGITFGNTSRPSASQGYLNVRDAIIHNVHVFGFTGGFRFGHYDTYLCTIRDSNFYNNLYNQYQPSSVAVNSGEGVRVESTTLSNSGHDNMYIDVNGIDFYYDRVHLDYANRDGIHFGINGASRVEINEPWIEGNYRYVISRQYAGSVSQSRVLFFGGKIVPNQYGVTYRGVRPIFSSIVYKSLIIETSYTDIDGAYSGYMCNDAYGTWVKPGDPTTFNPTYKISDTYKWLPSFKFGDGGFLCNTNYTFTGVAGNPLPTSVSAASDASAYHWQFVSGTGSIVYGDINDADSDGYIPIKITLADSSSIAYIYCANYINFPRPGIKLSSKCSVKCANATGSVIVQSVIRSLGYPTISGTTLVENVRSVTNGDQVDVLNTILTKSYLTVTKDDFVSTPPLTNNNFFLGSLWSNGGLKFSGFTGTIYVKLPAYWFSNINPNS